MCSALFGGQKGIQMDDFANVSSWACVYALLDDDSGMTMTNPMMPDRYMHVDHGAERIGRRCMIGVNKQ